jgi:hypothetical protein
LISDSLTSGSPKKSSLITIDLKGDFSYIGLYDNHGESVGIGTFPWYPLIYTQLETCQGFSGEHCAIGISIYMKQGGLVYHLTRITRRRENESRGT